MAAEHQGSGSALEADFSQCVQHLRLALAAHDTMPGLSDLLACADHLQRFLKRHAKHFQFDGFPLPEEGEAALCSYTLHQEPHAGWTLRINALHGGIDSVVHDHGTWALIIGLQGKELNRVYRREPVTTLTATATATATLTPEPSMSAIPAPGTAPALHAYGATPDCDLPVPSAFTLMEERWVGPGQVLVIEDGHFHSIHTPPGEPALQLHVYGSDPDASTERQLWDPTTGRLAGLG